MEECFICGKSLGRPENKYQVTICGDCFRRPHKCDGPGPVVLCNYTAVPGDYSAVVTNCEFHDSPGMTLKAD